jgi:DNA polymerase-3 subunit chi
MATRAEFHVLDGSDARARWKFACQRVEESFLAERRVLVWLDNDADAAACDDLLWTFADRSFVPHELVGDASDWEETPVLLASSRQPASPAQVIVNLGTDVPPGAAQAELVVEIIDADPGRRQAGRARFRRYRELGIEPVTLQPGA